MTGGGKVNAGHGGYEQCSGWTVVDAASVSICLPLYSLFPLVSTRLPTATLLRGLSVAIKAYSIHVKEGRSVKELGPQQRVLNCLDTYSEAWTKWRFGVDFVGSGSRCPGSHTFDGMTFLILLPRELAGRQNPELCI